MIDELQMVEAQNFQSHHVQLFSSWQALRSLWARTGGANRFLPLNVVCVCVCARA